MYKLDSQNLIMHAGGDNIIINICKYFDGFRPCYLLKKLISHFKHLCNSNNHRMMNVNVHDHSSPCVMYAVPSSLQNVNISGDGCVGLAKVSVQGIFLSTRHDGYSTILVNQSRVPP